MHSCSACVVRVRHASWALGTGTHPTPCRARPPRARRKKWCGGALHASEKPARGATRQPSNRAATSGPQGLEWQLGRGAAAPSPTGPRSAAAVWPPPRAPPWSESRLVFATPRSPPRTPPPLQTPNALEAKPPPQAGEGSRGGSARAPPRLIRSTNRKNTAQHEKKGAAAPHAHKRKASAGRGARRPPAPRRHREPKKARVAPRRGHRRTFTHRPPLCGHHPGAATPVRTPPFKFHAGARAAHKKQSRNHPNRKNIT